MATRGTHVALLRGINVGGRNPLAMARLQVLFDEAGCEDVRTYIQSGNVVFTAPAATLRRLAGELQDRIERELGLTVPVVLLTALELKRVVARNPFVAAGVAAPELHVGFLAGRPTAAAVAALDPKRSPPDEWRLVGRTLYLRCPNGVARTRLTNAYFDRTLGTVTTVRTGGPR